MSRHIACMAGLAAGLLALPPVSFKASADLAISANDGKGVLINGVNTVPDNPPADNVTILDLATSPPRAMAAWKLQRNDGQRHLVVESPVAHGGRPEVIWESPLAISRISARIRYRRGQRAVSKMRNKGSLPSRSTY